MPYNTTPIEPNTEPTGTSNLPLARTKKIISSDDDMSACSANATFAITIATELFIQHLVSQTYNVLKLEKKPRRQVAYRDVATAVAKHDNLEFLTDVVPRTVTYKTIKARKGKVEKTVDGTGGKDGLAMKGQEQRTLADMANGRSGNGRQGGGDERDIEMGEDYDEKDEVSHGDDDTEETVHQPGLSVAETLSSTRNVGMRYDAVRGDFEESGNRIEKRLSMDED